MTTKSSTPLAENVNSNCATLSKDTSAATQRKQIITLLERHDSINTLEFRNIHGIISPAPRIKELRDKGYPINSIRETVTTPDGRSHRGVARYYLATSQPAKNGFQEVA